MMNTCQYSSWSTSKQPKNTYPAYAAHMAKHVMSSVYLKGNQTISGLSLTAKIPSEYFCLMHNKPNQLKGCQIYNLTC